VGAVSVSGPIRMVLLVILGGLLLLVAACGGEQRLNTTAGSQPTVAPVTVAPPQPQPDGPLPAPAGPVVLSLTGKITRTNDGAALRLDPAMLDRLGLVRVAVYDPWAKKDLEFQGAWLQDLIDVARPTDAAQSVHLTALDDYQVDFSMSDVRAGGILLATKTGDGQPIPIADGGPLRIVFVGGVPSGGSADQWIWSLSTIDVR
jgi:hypothetical protein